MSPDLHRSRRSRLLVTLLSGLTGATALTALAAPGTASAAAPVTAAPAAADSVWTAVDDQPLRALDGMKRRVDPSSSTSYHLDLDALQARLAQAPTEAARSAVPATISVPSPSGELVEFAIAESPVMEAGLAAEHPEIQTYAGRTTSDDDLASIRLDVTPMGFHASVRSAGSATWYVDPAYNGVDQGADALYLSYRGDDLTEAERKLTEPDVRIPAGADRTADRQVARIGEGGGAVAIQRTYRLALVTDPSYATYFTSSPDQAVVNPIVTAEKVTLMNRVNQVYGDDLSVRMLLVAGNDALNFNTSAQFLSANGRCGNVACYTSNDVGCGDVIDTNRFVVGQIIGADKYDIGHIMFGPDGDGGGVAYLGAVGTEIKAGGCTGLAPPTGDGFAVDYVAHEMGHQFSGNHTFNGLTGSCAGGNREAATSVEPGSGTSVMAYAGICGVDNLQKHSDPYFSQRSQQEIAAFTRSNLGNLQEIQNVAMSGFTTAGESFTISYGGTASTITMGTNYTAAGLKAALETAEPSSATATVVGSKNTTFGTGVNGFQITWSGSADIPTPTVTLVSGTFTSIVGTYDNGGVQGNGGFNNPTPTGNHNPAVTAAAAKTIPLRTPFTLTGSATDADGDAMTYLWEQNNPGTTATVLSSNTKLAGPLFRIFSTYANVTDAGTQQYLSPGLNAAGTTPTRSFPDAAQVAAGATNAASGTCPTIAGTTGQTETAGLNCFSEFLPTTARTLNFRLTARDLGGADGGSDGGTSFGDTVITVGTAGPFLATSQPTATSVTGATAGTVTWNVASTNTATYATNVKISFSTDGGLTFPTVLAASTPNDGTEAITWPNTATTQGRIKIEAVDNYFYDVTDGNITIAPGNGATLTTGGNASGATFNAAFSDALTTTPTITAESSSVDGTAITGTAAGLPAGLSLTRGTSSATGVRPGTTSFTVTGTATSDPGSYPVTVTVGDATATNQTVSFTVVVGKDAATVTYTGDTAKSAAPSPTATVPLTLSATVADTDATPGTVSGTVAFTDQTIGTALCTATIAAGVASCTYDAPTLVSRTYQVVGTVTSTRYTGASTPTPVVVTVTAAATLNTGGNAQGGNFPVASSDAFGTAPTVSASASAVDGSAITMVATGLPAGLTLTRGATSEAGVRPGTTTFTVTGTADADAGSYPVSVVVSDGAGNAADSTVTFTVTVIKDNATVTYTGDTSSTGGTVTVSATAADNDATPGTVAGTIAFTDQTTSDALCSATIAAGEASCTFTAPATRTYQVVSTLTSPRYTGSAAAKSVVVTVSSDTTPPQTTITAGPAQNAFVLARKVTFAFDAEPGATYTCSIGAASAACNSGSLTLSSPKAGSYELRVTATDEAGNVDPTPATRRFSVPVTAKQLTVASGPWKNKSDSGAYRGSSISVAKKGATLTKQVTRATSLALVVTKAPGSGSVTVFLGSQKLKTVSLAGATKKQVVVALASFGTPKSGKVRIVTTNGKSVKIEGLGVRTSYDAARYARGAVLG